MNQYQYRIVDLGHYNIELFENNHLISIIFANHYLIAHGQGFLVIPEKNVPKFKQLLVEYYEGDFKRICGYWSGNLGKVSRERLWEVRLFVYDRRDTKAKANSNLGMQYNERGF